LELSFIARMSLLTTASAIRLWRRC